MDFAQTIASQINIRPEQAAAAIELLDAGNTIPFIARYRKEATRNLDEEQLRQLGELLEKLHALEERRQTVLKSIAEQDKLTPELQAQIEDCSYSDQPGGPVPALQAQAPHARQHCPRAGPAAAG